MKPQASDAVIEPAQAADAPVSRALLQAADLPHEDFATHLTHFLVARQGETVVGAVGFELHGREALLRSLVVTPDWRGGGLGDRLVQQLTEAAGQAGAGHFYLLTTTAEKFFKARGFKVVERTQVPAAIVATEEFRSLCPASAVCLARAVRG